MLPKSVRKKILKTKSVIVTRLPKPVRKKLLKNRVVQFVYGTSIQFYKSVNPHRGPRVYIKKGIGRMEFFEILNKRQVEYVLLRWWQDLPEMPPGEDMDILIKDEHRDLIEDLVTFNDRGNKLQCDIYTMSGSKHGSRRNLPYFQATLANTLINSRVLFRGVYVPSPKLYFASLTYHAIFHKGYNSGLPGYNKTIDNPEHNYTAILEDLAHELGISVDIKVTGLYNWLKEEGFAPADDTLTKLVEHKHELSIFERGLYSDARGGELLVYVIRDKLMQDGLLEDFTTFLEEKYVFDVIDIRVLSAAERETSRLRIRGGKWDKGPYRYSGGAPCAFVVAYDYYPKPLDSAEQKKQIRSTNKNNIESKDVYRKHVKNLFLTKGDYNGVHSADNELDAWSYISILGEDYRHKIATEVERRRARYAITWNVKKVLSAGAIAKAELIEYGPGFAVKKTFRIGKERFFERELYAVKELSKELEFIPPLLDEGDGYIVVPYMENILAALPEKEVKRVVATKRNDIIRVVKEMHARGFSYINFTPKNIIITADNEFYCKDFEYLHKYVNVPAKIEDTYEVAGLPEGFKGDYPDTLSIKTSSFNKVWGPYIGRWKKNT